MHLETALRGVIIGDRWPKSGAEVIVTVLEAEEDGWWADGAVLGGGQRGIGGWGMMTVLAGCITVASAAIAEAGIDCVDLVTGGVAAVVRQPTSLGGPSGGIQQKRDAERLETVLDPCPPEHQDILGACVVAYLASRDELTEVWMKGDVGSQPDALMDRAVEAAIAARTVLVEAVKESTGSAPGEETSVEHKSSKGDVVMSG